MDIFNTENTYYWQYQESLVNFMEQKFILKKFNLSIAHLNSEPFYYPANFLVHFSWQHELRKGENKTGVHGKLYP